MGWMKPQKGDPSLVGRGAISGPVYENMKTQLKKNKSSALRKGTKPSVKVRPQRDDQEVQLASDEDTFSVQGARRSEAPAANLIGQRSGCQTIGPSHHYEKRPAEHFLMTSSSLTAFSSPPHLFSSCSHLSFLHLPARFLHTLSP